MFVGYIRRKRTQKLRGKQMTSATSEDEIYCGVCGHSHKAKSLKEPCPFCATKVKEENAGFKEPKVPILTKAETVIFDQIARTVRKIPDISARYYVAIKIRLALENAGFVYEHEKWLIKCNLKPKKSKEE
jgi:hypothetical protein